MNYWTDFLWKCILKISMNEIEGRVLRAADRRDLRADQRPLPEDAVGQLQREGGPELQLPADACARGRDRQHCGA